METSKLIGEYKWEQYTIIQPLNEHENLWLVKEAVSEKILVMRRLPLSMQEVMHKLALLDHPNIVHLVDTFSFQQELYTIEEYLNGDNLAFLLEKNGAFGRKTMDIGRQLLNALMVLHQHHILHRDIKPENIMMDRLGHVVLMDFSIARLFSEEKDRDTSQKGTKTYAPPEQFGFNQTDCRTDIYALGITLNELATGKLPEEKICKGVLGKFIRRATQLDPKHRYPSASQALAHLQWMKRKQILLCSFVSALLLLSLLFGKRMLTDRVVRIDGQMQISSSFKDFALSDTCQKHLLSSPFPTLLYPSIRLDNGESVTFVEELSDTQKVLCTAQQNEETFTFTCLLISSSMQTEEVRFTFTDNYCSDYGKDSAQNGYLPEYELLYGDFDYDGQNEFLMIMARCKWYVPTLEEYAYYLTQYTCLWIIDLDENYTFVCSEPLLIPDENRPSLQNHFLIEDDWMRFYFYQDGKWMSSYLDEESYYLENGEWYLQ